MSKTEKKHTMKKRNSIIWILGTRNSFAFASRLFRTFQQWSCYWWVSMPTFRSLGHVGTKLGPKNRKKCSKCPILHFRVLEILPDLQFGSRQFHWLQLMQRTSDCLCAQVRRARCKKRHLGVKKRKKITPWKTEFQLFGFLGPRNNFALVSKLF